MVTHDRTLFVMADPLHLEDTGFLAQNSLRAELELKRRRTSEPDGR